MSYANVADHRSMALDRVRNDAYGRALAEVVGPDTVVLDLGAGTGIHGLMAARLGARHVYLVEPEDVAAVAEELAESNGLDARVTVLHGRIEDVIVPERVDVLVSVLTGNFLLSEDLIESLVFARERVLRPGGTLIPSIATMEAAPVSAGRLHDEMIAAWSGDAQGGVDLGAARRYAANAIYYRRDELRDVQWLAEPRVLHTIDLAVDRYEPVRVEATFEIAASGVCHGWVGWSRMKLGSEWLSTAPTAPRVHWSQAFLPLDPPMTFEAGERVVFTLQRAPHGDWAWGAAAGGRHQRHSTLLSRGMTRATLERAALDYVPRLNGDGQIVRDVLALCDGAHTSLSIAQSLHERYRTRFRTADDALAFLQRIIRRHA
jgi:SAM-dependent methyltransferase